MATPRAPTRDLRRDRRVSGLGRARAAGRAVPRRLADLIDATSSASRRRVPRHGDARTVAASPGDPARRTQLPHLRGAGRRLRRNASGSQRHRNRVIRLPSGPAVVITPWNAPFMLSTWKSAPALAAGCTVVLKPAEWSPLSCSLLPDLADEAGLPAGVFNIVQGIGEEIGAALVADPRVRGSRSPARRRPARHIGVAAARNIVPFTRRARRQGAADRVRRRRPRRCRAKAAGQYDDAGQVCLAGTRLLVDEAIASAFLERVQPLHRRARARRSARPATTSSAR